MKRNFVWIIYGIFVPPQSFSMHTKLVFFIPLISFLFFFRTIFIKSVKKRLRIPLMVVSFILFLFDLFIAVYFYGSCCEMAIKYNVDTCLSWIYPTLDFKLMVVLSVLILTVAMWGLFAGWSRKAFYLLAGSVLYVGVGFRVAIWYQSIEVMSTVGITNAAVVFEFFTIMVVYGLVSAAIYLGVAMLGFFRRFSYVVDE